MPRYSTRDGRLRGFLLSDDGVIIVRVLKILCDELLKRRDLLKRRLTDLRHGRPPGARHAHVRDVARVARLPRAGRALTALAGVRARGSDGPGARLLGQRLESRLDGAGARGPAQTKRLRPLDTRAGADQAGLGLVLCLPLRLEPRAQFLFGRGR